MDMAVKENLMAINFKEWLKSDEVKELQNTPVTKIFTEKFFRDPIRPIYRKPEVFYAPADGVVLYAHSVLDPDDPIVEIKGRNFSVKEALGDKNYDSPSLVIGIFMTFFSVHINRLPTDGYLVEQRSTPSIYTHGSSMLQVEEDIFAGKPLNRDTLEYLFCNERKVVTVFSPVISGRYYLIQIADKDVNAIINWADGDYLCQGDRYGQIRWGSQVDLIIPLEKDGCEFRILVNPSDYVKAGIDPIVEIVDSSLIK